jgi:hypothetical protein
MPNLPALQLPADLRSAGQIAFELSLSIQAVLQLAAAVGVSPVVTFDHVPYFPAEDIPRLRGQLQHDAQQLQLARLN